MRKSHSSSSLQFPCLCQWQFSDSEKFSPPWLAHMQERSQLNSQDLLSHSSTSSSSFVSSLCLDNSLENFLYHDARACKGGPNSIRRTSCFLENMFFFLNSLVSGPLLRTLCTRTRAHERQVPHRNSRDTFRTCSSSFWTLLSWQISWEFSVP